MLLDYEGKVSEKEIKEKAEIIPLKIVNKQKDSLNKLIFGENINVMKTLIEDYGLKGKVDLVYIDPPFSTKNVFKIGDSRANTISSSHSDQIAYSDSLTGSEFIEFLRERLVLIKDLMSKNASIYLHIDYKIGHYVKIIMDEIFGYDNFRADIARIKCNPKNFKRKSYGNIKDMILFYTKSKDYSWNDPRVPFTKKDIERLFKKADENGRRYTTVPLHAPGETKDGPTGQKWKGMYPPKGRHWRSNPIELDKLDQNGLIEWSKNGVPRKKIYAEDKIAQGKLLQDIWEYKDSQTPSYPTQKNLDLLKLIISASSNPGDLVLDAFCGSGTTLVASQELSRNWIGIDSSENAIKVSKERLSKVSGTLFSPKVEYSLLESVKI
ncbi:MAG: site-specific DNA-methyltransferase [Methanobacterium sp.]